MSTTPSFGDLAYLAAAFLSYSAFTWLFLRALIAWDVWLAKPRPSPHRPRGPADRRD